MTGTWILFRPTDREPDGSAGGRLPEPDLGALRVANHCEAALARHVARRLDDDPAVRSCRGAGVLQLVDGDVDPECRADVVTALADRAAVSSSLAKRW